MNTFNIFRQLAIVAVAVIAFLNYNHAVAQTEATVLAISKDGISHKAPTSLRVAVISSNNPMIFKVCLENMSTDYVMIVMKNEKGNVIHRKCIFHEKKAVTRYNMSRFKEGNYTVEVATRSELHRYQINLVSEVVRSVEIKPGILATLPR